MADPYTFAYQVVEGLPQADRERLYDAYGAGLIDDVELLEAASEVRSQERELVYLFGAERERTVELTPPWSRYPVCCTACPCQAGR